MRLDVQSVVRWGVSLVLVCAAAACGDASSGAPVDTPQGVVSEPVDAPQLADTTAPPPVTTLPVLPSTSSSPGVVTVPTSPPTTAPVGSASIDTVSLPREVSDSSVLALAAVLGVDGEVEAMERNAKCIGRLAPRGLCVNGPISGAWQYWDLDAQSAAGASDQEAGATAVDVFVRIGVDPGVVTSIEPNGPLPQVELSNGASVMVAEGGRIAWMIASIDQMPQG